MTTHVFAAFVTSNGTAANNRGVTEGNITTLQKLLWNGHVHTTVSAEAIRFALRRRLAEAEECNRTFDEDERCNDWKDPAFTAWTEKSKRAPYVDDDLLGFMSAEAASEERKKGTTRVRRAVLEVTRAVSLTPWSGDVTFNAASPDATPSAQKKGSNPVPYGTEMHATRFQYGVAMTPDRLRVSTRAALALRSLCALGQVAGNHGRFLFDFSPESAVFRITSDPAPRILYAFSTADGNGVVMPDLLRKLNSGDIKAKELIIGGAIVDALDEKIRGTLTGGGAVLRPGVLAACEAACERLPGAKG